MKNYLILMLAGVLALSSCTTTSTYSEWNRGTTGAYVGSMFGSLIGDLIGGPKGSAVGALIGGATGAAVGVASAQNEQEKYSNNYAYNYNKKHRNDRYNNYKYDYDDGIYYGNGNDYSYVAPSSPADFLDVTNVVFADQNNNRILESGETAYVTFEINNRSDKPIYNVAPIITCDNKRIAISSTATIARIDAHKGMRYKAVVRAQSNVRSGQTTFYIGFAERGNRLDPAKSFRIYVRR